MNRQASNAESGAAVDLQRVVRGRGRPRIRTPEYRREYLRLKQQEWRKAHPKRAAATNRRAWKKYYYGKKSKSPNS
jgi:hypothetical protein